MASSSLVLLHNDNFIAFQPRAAKGAGECSTERAFSFYLAVDGARDAFSASKNPLQVLSSSFDARPFATSHYGFGGKPQGNKKAVLPQ